MGKVTWKPGTMLYPLPVAMVSCGTLSKSNIITIAWTGIVNSQPPMTYVSIRPERHSYRIIKESGEFVINLTTERLVRNADFCGVRSGREFNKFSLPGLTPVGASSVSAPMIYESPVNIECKVRSSTLLGSHEMFVAEIVAVNVDDRLLDSKGVLHLERASLVCLVHGKYTALGRQLGCFGYSVKKNQR
ncbi:MAG: flavin reductase family protein, partial [Synergistes sp.]|nr:flavin reductase family protein [Synergistes sp.]